MSLISFGSDNHSGIHPQLLQSLIEVNSNHYASYEQDPWSQKLKQQIKKEFNALDSYLVFNGTAANVLSIQACLESYHSVLCTDVSHLNTDECGAPEKITGCKLIPVPSQNGKFIFSELEQMIFRKGDQHFSQIKMLSFTQPTEYGTVYSFDEMKMLRDFCDKHDLFLHMDGARLANASARLNLNFSEISKFSDILSFGGAKNGLMLGELVIVRSPKITKDLKFFRKQSLQLPSKTRFIAAPFLKYLENNLWHEIAQHENAMTQRLFEGLSKLPSVEITQKPQANGLFCIFPRPILKELRKKFFFYIWNEQTFEVRLMTSFDTTQEDVDAFLTEVDMLLKA